MGIVHCIVMVVVYSRKWLNLMELNKRELRYHSFGSYSPTVSIRDVDPFRDGIYMYMY